MACIKKTFLVSMVILLVFVGFMPSSAQADGRLSKYYEGSFTEDWSKTAAFEYAKINYGFNTTLINEDTCDAYNSNARHYAFIRNGNGVHVGSAVPAGSRSRIEVSHSGSRVEYACEW